MLKRNYAYNKGDIEYSVSGIRLTCKTAGTTSTEDLVIPPNVNEVTDGTVVWSLIDISRGGSGEGVVTWEGGKDYQINTLTVQNNNLYVCIQNHTSSSSFKDDVASGKWALLIGDSGTSNNALGTIISYMGTTPPMNHLACDGTVYNIEDYQELANFINAHFGSYNFFGGDGITTFAVPDLRGEFLRGSGTNSHASQGSGANVGVHQDGTEIPYFRNLRKSNNLIQVRDNVANIEPNNLDSSRDGVGYGNIDCDISGDSTTDLRPCAYTIRPTNTSVLFCIRYNKPKPLTQANAIRDILYSGSDQVSATTGSVTYSLSRDISNYDYLIAKVVVNYNNVNGDETSTFEGTQLIALPISSTQVAWDLGFNVAGNLYARGWYRFSGQSAIFALREFNTTRVNFVYLASVTGIKLVNPNQYSTKEQRIGTWIDGKPLYQITIQDTMPSTTAVETRVVKSIDVDSLCIETPVSIAGICLYGTTTSACALNANLESVGGKIHFCETHVSKAEAGRANFGYIRIGNATPYLNGFPVYITIQYTKTTD